MQSESKDDGAQVDRGSAHTEGYSSVRSVAMLGELCLYQLHNTQGCFRGVPIGLTHSVPVFHKTESHVDPV